MALNNLGLGFVFTASDRASGAIGRVGNQFDRTAGRARLGSGIMRAGLIGIGAAAAATAAGIGTLMGAFRLAQIAGEFGQTMARVGALTRATGDDMQALRNSAIQAGIATQFSPAQAAEGLAELGVRGLSARESIAALTSSLDLAAGGQISVAQSSSTLAAALRVFSIDANDAGLATDQLLRISNVTALQAGDLEIALGNVSRGAGVAQQSIEEMLPAIGLVRNTGVEASSAATGVSTALIRMAQQRGAFQRLGVSVTDAAGNFRPFLDVVRETDVALRDRFVNAAERAEAATELFGVRGLGAFQAIANQLNGQIRDAEGNSLSAADAVDFLRDSMVNAGGAAAEFRERMLDTFEGQQTLLNGTIETLQTVTGESFGKVFRPFVEAITNTLNMVIQVFTSLPEPIRTSIAGIVVALGALLTVFGSATGIAIGIALIIPFLKVIAIVLGIVAIALLPVIAGIAIAAAAVLAFKIAVERNVGGIGDFFQRGFAQIRLVFSGLQQLFSDGGFSGEVRDEMNRAENQGIRAFVINIFAIGHRIKAFFEGLVAGIGDGIEAAAPAFEVFQDALRELGEAFGFVSDGADELAGGDSSGFFIDGHVLGQRLADVLVFVVNVITGAVRFFSALTRTVRAGMTFLQPLFTGVGEAVGRLSVAFGALTGEAGSLAEGGTEAGGTMTTLGEFIGGFLIGAIAIAVSAFGLIVDILAVVIGTIAFFVNVGRSAFAAIGDFIDDTITKWNNFGDNVTIIVNSVLADALRLVRSMPGPIASALGIDQGAVAGQEQALLAEAQFARARVGVRNARQGVRAAERLPAGAERQAAQASAERTSQAATENLMRLMGRQPVQVQSTLVVDGEVLARASERGQRSNDANSFRTAPLGSED